MVAIADFEEVGAPRPLTGLVKSLSYRVQDFDETEEYESKALEVVPKDADLSLVLPKFMHWLLVDEEYGLIRHALNKKKIQNVAHLWQRIIDNKPVDEREWEKTWQATFCMYSSDCSDACALFAASYACYAGCALSASHYVTYAEEAVNATVAAIIAVDADVANAQASIANAGSIGDAAYRELILLSKGYAREKRRAYKVQADKLIELLTNV